MNVDFIGTRTCMDCGKEFKPTLIHDSPKPYKCWYWGKINPLMMKYSWGIPFNEYFLNPPKMSWWRTLLKNIIPCYYHTHEDPSVKPITERWLLKLREMVAKLTFHSHPSLEMWTCHECVFDKDMTVCGEQRQ